MSIFYAFLASVCWSVAPIIGASAARVLGSYQFTRVRTTIAAMLFLLALTWNGGFSGITSHTAWLLVASSIVGIAIGDFLLFYALKVLGPRRSGILYSFNVPFTAVFSYLLLSESISGVQIVGLTIASIGIVIAVAFRSANTKSEITMSGYGAAVIAGVGAAICQSLGIILAKPALAQGLDALAAASIRLLTASVVLHLPIVLSRDFQNLIPRVDRSTMLRTVAAAVIGTCCGVYFLMMAIVQGSTALTSLFSSLSPLLMLPLLALIGVDRPRPLAWIGAAVATIGLTLIITAPALGLPIKVAAVYPSTGKDADFLCITKALAGWKVNRKHSYHLSVYDNAQDTIETRIVMPAIIAGSPIAVLGTRTSQEALVASDVLNKEKIPFIAPISAHPGITMERDWTLRIVGDSTSYSRLWASYTHKVVKGVRVATVTNLSQPYSMEYIRSYTKSLADLAPEVSLVNYDIIDGFDSFQEVAKAIVDRKIDTVFMAMYAEQVTPLVEALAKHNARITVLSTGGMNDGSSLVASVLARASGIKFLFNGVWNKNPEGIEAPLYEHLMRKFCPTQAHTMRTVLAFDAMNELVKAAESTANPTRASVREYLRRAGVRRGVSGSYEVTRDGSTIRPMQIYSIAPEGTQYVGKYE